MHHRILSVLLLLAVFFTTISCESYPLGMSKEEWTSLTPQERADALEKQAAIDAERRRVQAEERRIAAEEEAIRQQAAADEAARQQARLDELYRHARFGDIVSINIEGGTLRFGDDHRTYEPVAVDLIRGEARKLVIHRDEKRKYTVSVLVRLSDDGRTLYFDDDSSKPLRLIEKTWDRGQVYQIEKHSNNNANPRGVTFTIRYKPLRRR